MKVTIGKRITIGFAVVILIAVVLGGIGVNSMLRASDESEKLASEYVPEVKVVSDLRGAANRLMYQMRGFSMSEKESYYDAANEELDELHVHLQEADRLADESVHLTALKGQIDNASKAVDKYADLMKKTDETIAKMNVQRDKLDQNAASFMANCSTFLDAQNAELKKDLADRQNKIKIVTAIVDRGTKARVTNFKSQVDDDMDSMMQAVDLVKGLDNELAVLRPITHVEANKQQMDKIESAASKYAVAMEAYISTREKLEKAAVAMNENAAEYMLNCEAFLDSQNKRMKEEMSEDGADLAERLNKISLVQKIKDAGFDARLTNFKAQATNDDQLLQTAIDKMNGVGTLTADLRNITRQDSNLKQLETIDKAASAYMTAMQQYQKGLDDLASHRMDMNSAAGAYVENCEAFLISQQEALTRDMHERQKKLDLATDIVALCNDARVKAFKAQSLDSPEIMSEAIPNFELLEDKYAELRAITRRAEDLKLIDNAQKSGQNYAGALNVFLAEWSELKGLGTQREQAGTAVVKVCRDTTEAGMTATDQIAKSAATILSRDSSIMIGGLAIGTIIAIVASIFISRSINGPLTRIINGLNEGSVQVTEAATQVSGASQDLASGASEQASSLEETSSSLEQMASMAKTNAQSATEANQLSLQACSAASESENTIIRLNEAMGAINDSSTKISKIIKVIEEIAFQTNLLALNAAVEAARAGEHGQGFAVVADEVRNLAMRAAEAAQETTTLIEDSVGKAKEGTTVAQEVGDALNSIAGDVNRVSDLINMIAKSSDDQNQGVEQINIAVSQMTQVTQKNAAGAEESASAVEELSMQADMLQNIVKDLSILVSGTTLTTAQKKGGFQAGGQDSLESKDFAQQNESIPVLTSSNPNVGQLKDF